MKICMFTKYVDISLHIEISVTLTNHSNFDDIITFLRYFGDFRKWWNLVSWPTMLHASCNVQNCHRHQEFLCLAHCYWAYMWQEKILNELVQNYACFSFSIFLWWTSYMMNHENRILMQFLLLVHSDQDENSFSLSCCWKLGKTHFLWCRPEWLTFLLKLRVAVTVYLASNHSVSVKYHSTLKAWHFCNLHQFWLFAGRLHFHAFLCNNSIYCLKLPMFSKYNHVSLHVENSVTVTNHSNFHDVVMFLQHFGVFWNFRKWWKLAHRPITLRASCNIQKHHRHQDFLCFAHSHW